MQDTRTGLTNENIEYNEIRVW